MAASKGEEEFKRLLREQSLREQGQPGLNAGVDAARRERASRHVDDDTIWVHRDRLDSNGAQPRDTFTPAKLATLGESLRRDGQLQALVVRPHPLREGMYQIVSGERRWRASAPEYGDVPQLRVTVRNLTDAVVKRLALVENIHREDLTPLEKSRGLAALRMSPKGDILSIRGLEIETGLKKSHIARLLALQELPRPIQKRFADLSLNEQHGRALLLLQGDARAQNQLLREIEPEAGVSTDDEPEPRLNGAQAWRRAEALKKPKAPPASTWTTSSEVAVEAASTATPVQEQVAAPTTGSKEGVESVGGDSREEEEASQETAANPVLIEVVETPRQPIADLHRGTGFDQGSTPQATRYDPLGAHLRPALAQLTEAARRAEETPESPEYIRDVLAVLASIEAQSKRLREGIRSQQDAGN